LDRETQGRLLPVGSRAGVNFEAHGSESSRPNRKHSLTVLTLVHRFNSFSITSARKVYALSAKSRASCNGCRTPTSLSNSKKARSGADTSGASTCRNVLRTQDIHDHRQATDFVRTQIAKNLEHRLASRGRATRGKTLTAENQLPSTEVSPARIKELELSAHHPPAPRADPL
jgi:hypothetical protein